MKRSTYIFIYGLIASSFFGIIPFGYLSSIARGAVFDVMELLWFAFGIYIYPRSSKRPRLHSNFLVLFYISVIPSFFMSKYLFGQSLIQSFITSRPLLLYLAIPALFRISPTPKEIMKGCYLYSVCFIIISLARTFIPVKFYVESEKEISYFLGSGDFLNRPIEICVVMIILPLMYYCQQLYKNFQTKYFLKILILFLIVVCMQNRSTLFPVVIIIGLTFLLSKWKSQTLKYVFLGIIGLVASYVLATMVSSMLEETTTQLASTGDPRVMALAYFFDLNRMSWQEILFGTGNISFVTSSYVEDLQAAHIHYSDVGMIGLWSVYGIFTVGLMLWYIILTLSKRSPLYMKFFGIMTLICCLTINYFNSAGKIPWFVLLLYLYEYYRSKAHHRKFISKSRHKRGHKINQYEKEWNIQPVMKLN